ncbi:phosphotransferase enzyme family protein [Georgenia deserti]|uniref:Phosphotransferase enzyme family protein n=1 Tax=Georgenia deserti TaxID=2093781 RepID=A0ABW4L8L5_9MICO
MDSHVAATIARAALDRFAIARLSTVTFVKYRENHVFRIDTPSGESYALRLHRPGYRNEREIDTELRYVEALARRGVPVPSVVRACDGEPYARVTAARHTRVVSVLRWLPDARQLGDAGEAFLTGGAETVEAFRDVGSLLGRFHRAAQALERPAGFERAAWDADGLAGTKRLWGDPCRLRGLDAHDRALLGDAAAFVRARLATVGEEASCFGVIHADTTPENILSTPTGLWLIDFDDFGTGWYVFDLVTALFHHTPHPRYLQYRDALLTAYQAHRPLTRHELELWDPLMLARGMSYLGWAADRPGDPASDFVADHVAPWVLRAAHALTTGTDLPWRAGSPGTAVTTSGKGP